MPSPNLTLPAGTQVVTKNAIWGETGQVVCPAGAVGIIIASPADHHNPYLVRFNNGFEAGLLRHQLIIRKHFQQNGVERAGQAALAVINLNDHIIYRCVVGSRAYGLDDESSDTDLHHLPPCSSLFRLC